MFWLWVFPLKLAVLVEIVNLGFRWNLNSSLRRNRWAFIEEFLSLLRLDAHFLEQSERIYVQEANYSETSKSGRSINWIILWISLSVFSFTDFCNFFKSFDIILKLSDVRIVLIIFEDLWNLEFWLFFILTFSKQCSPLS